MEKGKSVGAIITDATGRYLVQYRLRHPVGLAMPAGHVDAGDESPEEAIQRELFEETGLYITQLCLVFEGFVPGDCACAAGHQGHDWRVYFLRTENEPRIKEPDKHLFMRYMSASELREWARKNKLDPGSFPCDPNWFDHILPALNIL